MFLATPTRSSRATVKKWCNKEHWNPASSKSKLISEQESCSDQLRGALAQPCRRDPCASSCHCADSRLAVNHRTTAHVNETQTGSEQASASTRDDTVKLLLRRKMDGGPGVTCRWLPCPVLPFARVEFPGTGNSTRRVTYHTPTLSLWEDMSPRGWAKSANRKYALFCRTFGLLHHHTLFNAPVPGAAANRRFKQQGAFAWGGQAGLWARQ